MPHTHSAPSPHLPAPPPILMGDRLHHALLGARLRQRPFAPATMLVALSVRPSPSAPPLADGEPALLAQLASLIGAQTGAPFVGYAGRGLLLFVLPPNGAPHTRLHALVRHIAAMPFAGPSGRLRLLPAAGYVPLSTHGVLDRLKGQAIAALRQAELADDLQPVRAARSPAPRRRSLASEPAGRSLAAPAQIALTVLLGFVAPYLLIAGLRAAGIDITPTLYLFTVFTLLATSYLIWYEGFQAMREVAPPTEPPASYPPASAIVAAYLPNEATTIVESLRVFLSRLHYPAPLELILAYNTPHDLPVEAALRELAERDPRLRLLRVAGSSSKAQNVNAALAVAGGAFVGVFDADHHPAPDAFTRAWRWLAGGYDVVQGHCVIRNGDESWVTRLVSVEFETIYAVAHPGRARMHGFGLFGGSNGYWRTEVLRDIRMRATMLTEDIDASLRALLAGHRIASDPLILSYELAPLTLSALWHQRLRWAQGWFQVSLAHSWAALTARRLSPRQKLGVFHLLVWRELYPWLSIQVLTVLAFWVLHDGLAVLNLLVPLFVLTTLLTFSSGPAQVLFAYLLGSPVIRRRWHWYLAYLLSATLYYSSLKNLISRVAMVKEALRERHWRVTPRVHAAAPRTGGNR